MAIIANLYIDQGTDFSITVDCTDVSGEVLNLTGYTAAAQIRKTYSSSTVSATFCYKYKCKCWTGDFITYRYTNKWIREW